MTLDELIAKLNSLISTPDSATVYIRIDDVVVEADYVEENKNGSVTIW